MEGRPYAGMSAEARREARRQRLLDAALELFGTQGYAATRIEQICSVAGVATKHFYEAFGGREDLLLALYAEIVERHAPVLQAAMAGAPDDPAEHVRATIAGAVEAWTEDRRHARIAFIEVVGVSEEVERRRHDVLEGYAQLVAADFAGLVARGRLRERDYAWWARAVVGAFTQVVEFWLLRDDDTPVDALTDELASLLAAGVAGATLSRPS